MSNAVRIHHFPKSGHAHRAVVFAKLAGIAHEAVFVDLAAGAHKTPEFLAMNPNGQVPVLEDGETVIADSNAILVYLARKYAPDWMPGDAEGVGFSFHPDGDRVLYVPGEDFEDEGGYLHLVTDWQRGLVK